MLTVVPSTARAWAEVDLGAIRANVAALRTHLPFSIQLLAVVKADAYGHGLVPVARSAWEAGAAWLGVATVDEGSALRSAGIEAPIALLCAPLPEQAGAIVKHRLTAAVGDMTTLQALAAVAKHAKAGAEPAAIHLEIDTGMGRSGAQAEEALALWQAARAIGTLKVTGLATHFADADGPDTALTHRQEQQLRQVRAALERDGARFEVVHLSNSAGTLRFQAAGGNLIRPGLLLYGISPSLPAADESSSSERRQDTHSLALRPALTLKARVATVRALPAGHPISYGATHRLTRASLVATVLIGYGDGYPRRLSNRGHLLLQGRRAPILGRVCMDQTVVDVTDIPGVAPGMEAVCIGAQGTDRIAVEEIATRIETTEHEITTCLTARIPRIYLT
jgi:alanine racemase